MAREDDDRHRNWRILMVETQDVFGVVCLQLSPTDA